MKIIRGLALAGLLALAACQSGGGTADAPEAPVAAVAGSARIVGAVVAAEQRRDGVVDTYDFVVAFRSQNGVGAHFTRSRLCHVVDGSCVNRDIDFTVPASGVAGFRTSFGSDYDLDVDGYTGYLTGVDTRGNAVRTEFTFSTSMVGRLPPIPSSVPR
jgi:hypothetical protein